MIVKRPCKISSDCFCYVCGYYISPQQKKNKVIPETKFFIAYETYFGMKMGNLDKSWAPHFCCANYRSTLEGWMRGSRKCMPFAIPQIWREPTTHHDDCYFCMVDISKYNKAKEQEKDSLSKYLMTAISAWWTFPNTKRQRTRKRLFI